MTISSPSTYYETYTSDMPHSMVYRLCFVFCLLHKCDQTIYTQRDIQRACRVLTTSSCAVTAVHSPFSEQSAC